MTQIWETFVNFFEQALTTLADTFSFAGGYRWALAIVALTVITRTLLLPLAIKQIRSMRETQRLQPEVARLRQKHKSDRQKLMQEMQELYQREGVNPYASCLPMLAQAPVFMATYFAIRDIKPNTEFFGALLTDKASATVIGWVLIVIMTLAQLLSTRQLNPGQTDQQRRTQMLMPLVFVFLFINFDISLVLYWTTGNVFQLVQQLIMTRDMREPGSGWRGILGIGQNAPAKGGTKQKGGKGKSQNGKGPKPEKPQVKMPSAPAPRPEKEPARVPSAAPSADPLAARRNLDEKRQRRRRNKKKRKR